jgi:hypothetical protein
MESNLMMLMKTEKKSTMMMRGPWISLHLRPEPSGREMIPFVVLVADRARSNPTHLEVKP